MKRILLLIATNFAVMLVLSIVVSVLGFDRWLDGRRAQLRHAARLLRDLRLRRRVHFAADVQAIAKMVHRRAHDRRRRGHDAVLAGGDRAQARATRPASACPRSAIYEGAPNAFATGAFAIRRWSRSRPACCESMSREEVEAVLGHEISHVANGDMVTLTLIQGVVNTFVFFLSRVVGYVVDKAVFQHRARRRARLLHHRDRLRRSCSASSPR